MTRYDELDLRVLEHDLETLAEPREEDERVRLALRAQLAAGLRPHPTPRRRISRRIAVGFAAGAAAAAAIGLVTAVGTTGSGGPAIANAAIVHRTLHAVTPPPNEILHVKVVGMQNGVAVAAETWQQTSAPYGSRGLKGGVGRQGEFGDNGTNSVQYDPLTNTISEQPDSSPPRFTDPVSQIREELAAGRAQNVGTVMLDGNRLYKIDLPHGLVGYFDGNDYQPRYLDDPQRDGSVVRLHVVAYEYLPMTPSNRALLSVTAQHPTARIDTSPHAETGK
jgi:hypothetical protein